MFKTIFISIMLACFSITAQTGTITGKVKDKNSGEEIPFVMVKLYGNDTIVINATHSDLNGYFSLQSIKPGTYRLVCNYIGYQKSETKGIVVKENQKTIVAVSLNTAELLLNNVTIKEQRESKKLLREESNKIQESVQQKQDLVIMGKISNKQSVVTNGATPTFITGGTPAHYAEFNTEQYNKIDDNGFKEVSKDPLSTMSIDVDRASYSNVRRFITKGSMPPADAVRVEEMINYFSYNYPQPKNNVPFSITTEYTECAWNKKHSLIHIGIQGKEMKTENLPANNLVFLIDVSGSMMSADKLPLVKSGLRLLVDQLRTQDKVSLVVYAGAAGLVLAPTPGNEKEKIMDAIDQLEAGGSTAGGQGIELAYKTAKESFMSSGNNRVILATDGDFNVGVSDDGSLVRMIEKKREDGIFLTVLGFGTGNYKDSKMEQLADKGNGNYAYIDDILEAKKVLVKEMGGTLLTIAKDVKIQIEFNPSKVKAYRLVGYENRLLNKEDFNDDKKDAGELGAGHTVTAIYEIIPAGSDEAVASVDPLKYQETKVVAKSSTNEIMTIKFRYKEPKETTSKLITEVVNDDKKTFSKTSENCKFASAVAQFGMLLRDSKYKADADYKSVIALAKDSKGTDDEGYRAEFIRLVEMAQLLKK